MPLVPTDFAERLAARGLNVKVLKGWDTHGKSADHQAVVLHHTASSSSTRPEDDAAACHHGTDVAPLYNVLVDRTGVVWLLARKKANSSGDISSIALNEVLDGRAGVVSAGARKLVDDTTANAKLFSIAAQNNGVGEDWSDALVDSVCIVAAEALIAFGTPDSGFVTQHRVLTKRKIDCCGGNCPTDDFQSLITTALKAGPLRKRGAMGMCANPKGGYYVFADDGGVFAFGAPFFGSMGDKEMDAPVVGMAVRPKGDGYILCGSDGAVFAFGRARVRGSLEGKPLAAPITGCAFDPDGDGYYLVGQDGGVFAFDAPFHGSATEQIDFP
jgi:hypothetical protein